MKAEIVRCVTQEERRKACRSRDICCHLIDEEQVIAASHYQNMSPDQENKEGRKTERQ